MLSNRRKLQVIKIKCVKQRELRAEKKPDGETGSGGNIQEEDVTITTTLLFMTNEGFYSGLKVDRRMNREERLEK